MDGNCVTQWAAVNTHLDQVNHDYHDDDDDDDDDADDNDSDDDDGDGDDAKDD